MEPEGSLPHSQVPATCPYPEPARSSPYPHIPLPEDPSYYYLPIYAKHIYIYMFVCVCLYYIFCSPFQNYDPNDKVCDGQAIWY